MISLSEVEDHWRSYRAFDNSVISPSLFLLRKFTPRIRVLYFLTSSPPRRGRPRLLTHAFDKLRMYTTSVRIENLHFLCGINGTRHVLKVGGVSCVAFAEESRLPPIDRSHRERGGGRRKERERAREREGQLEQAKDRKIEKERRRQRELGRSSGKKGRKKMVRARYARRARLYSRARDGGEWRRLISTKSQVTVTTWSLRRCCHVPAARALSPESSNCRSVTAEAEPRGGKRERAALTVSDVVGNLRAPSSTRFVSSSSWERRDWDI